MHQMAFYFEDLTRFFVYSTCILAVLRFYAEYIIKNYLYTMATEKFVLITG